MNNRMTEMNRRQRNIYEPCWPALFAQGASCSLKRSYLNCLAVAAALALVSLGGCSKGSSGGGSLNGMMRNLVGPSPSELVAWAFDPNDPDRRRMGVLGLSSKKWGLKEPYLKGYAALLKTDKDPLVRAAAARALGKAKDPNYAPAVTRALLDTNVNVRQDVATALDSVYDDTSAGPLRNRAAGDVDQDVRAKCCRALRHHRSIAVARTLVDCLSDKTFSVRHQAHASLVEIVGDDRGYDAENWATVVSGAALPPKPVPQKKPTWWQRMRQKRKKPAAPKPADPKESDSAKTMPEKT